MSEDVRLQLQEEDAAHAQARELLVKLALCLKLATIHELSNAAMGQPIRQLVSDVNESFAHHDAVHLQTIGENIYLNHELVRLSYSTFESALTLRKIYKRLGVAELGFVGRLDDSELRSFLESFQRHYRSSEPGNIVSERFANIVVRAIDHAREDEVVGEIDERRNVLRCYARVAVTAADSVRALSVGRPARLARLKRALQGLADASLGHESLLIGLTRFPNLSGELSFHLTSVAALVLLMTRRLGASRVVISECCMCAILHDVGRGMLEDAFADADAQVDRLLGTQRVVAMKSMLSICKRNISPRALFYAAAAYEHSLPLVGHDPSAVARLVAVPCGFDLMTSPGMAEARLQPDQAMRVLLDNAPERYDEAVVQLFAQTIGLYPVGSTVTLSGGELAIVVDVPSDPARYAEPMVKVIVDARGQPVDHLLDLASAGRGMQIVTSVDPIERDINVPAFLLA